MVFGCISQCHSFLPSFPNRYNERRFLLCNVHTIVRRVYAFQTRRANQTVADVITRCARRNLSARRGEKNLHVALSMSNCSFSIRLAAKGIKAGRENKKKKNKKTLFINIVIIIYWWNPVSVYILCRDISARHCNSPIARRDDEISLPFSGGTTFICIYSIYIYIYIRDVYVRNFIMKDFPNLLLDSRDK